MPASPHVNRNRKRGIAREAVIDAALSIIDAHGVDALTMRKLADALDVFPTTIYWHAGNRADLISHVCHYVLSGVAVPDAEVFAWEEWVLVFARESRGAFSRHPNLAADFASQIHTSVTGMTMADALLRVLSDAGFAGDELIWAYNTVMGGVFGWISAEFAHPPTGDTGWASRFMATLKQVTPATFPAVHQNRKRLTNRAFMFRWSSGSEAPLTESFEFAMAVMIAGLRAVLAEAALDT